MIECEISYTVDFSGNEEVNYWKKVKPIAVTSFLTYSLQVPMNVDFKLRETILECAHKTDLHVNTENEKKMEFKAKMLQEQIKYEKFKNQETNPMFLFTKSSLPAKLK